MVNGTTTPAIATVRLAVPAFSRSENFMWSPAWKRSMTAPISEKMRTKSSYLEKRGSPDFYSSQHVGSKEDTGEERPQYSWQVEFCGDC